jgi:hypothetical protein
MLTVPSLREGGMSVDLLIYLAVVAVLGIVYMIRKRRREGSRLPLGDADAYEGNLVAPPTGEPYRTRTGHKWHGGHDVHDAGHVTHGGGHTGHHGVNGGHHH